MEVEKGAYRSKSENRLRTKEWIVMGFIWRRKNGSRDVELGAGGNEFFGVSCILYFLPRT